MPLLDSCPDSAHRASRGKLCAENDLSGIYPTSRLVGIDSFEPPFGDFSRVVHMTFDLAAIAMLRLNQFGGSSLADAPRSLPGPIRNTKRVTEFQ